MGEAGGAPLWATLTSSSFLEYAFLRWVLTPAVLPAMGAHVVPQAEAGVEGRNYLIDYEIRGANLVYAVELDGFAFHGNRQAFSYDRLRQNDLTGTGRHIIRFSYDSIRSETGHCVKQLQEILRNDPALAQLLVAKPIVEPPDMDPDPLFALESSPTEPLPLGGGTSSYFASVVGRLNMGTLRECQSDAFAALANYYGTGGTNAACVMSVGAGKTALGVASCLGFARRRAMVVTPGSVIRGTFDRAFDPEALGNVLNGLPRGPLIPGVKPPKVLTLDREDGVIKRITREQLLAADVIVTNFHSLGTGEGPDDILSKLEASDIDFVVVDEAHIAAAESYQRLFEHFSDAHTLLMSACFQRMDGKTIDADVVYRYRLIDSIADGNAKNLRVTRFAPDPSVTTYEINWPDGHREEIVGREVVLDLLKDEKKLARITAKSAEPIHQIMVATKKALDLQAAVLAPIRPRVLFSALGELHAAQIAGIAEQHGIPCAHLHHSMTEAHIKAVRKRFEQESGDLQGIVQLRMLGQGYDFPPITVVVSMRPYASFGEFYQFVGRGIRVINDLALAGRIGPADQFLDVIYHAELGLDTHIQTIYLENNMDPPPEVEEPDAPPPDDDTSSGDDGADPIAAPEAFVLFEEGAIDIRVVHDQARVDRRREERRLEALAQSYAKYVEGGSSPMNFEEYVKVIESAHG